MSEGAIRLDSSRKMGGVPRGKSHRQTEAKTTVGVYLPKTLVLKAKENKLNLSRILEEALSSILNHLEAQNCETSVKREGMETVGCHIGVVGRAGFEPATLRFLHYLYAW